MIVGYYSGASAIDYNEQKLAAVTNNLANINKPAYKSSEFVMRTRKVNPATRWINPLVLKRLPPLYGVQRAGVYKDFQTENPINETSNPMNIAIDPSVKNGFFNVRKSGDSNNSETYYTRNGTLSMGQLDPSNPDGIKVLKSGSHTVLDSSGNPIELSPSGGELNITKDGEVFQSGVRLGEISVYRFNKSPDPTQVKDSNLQSLIRLGESLYKIPPKLKNEFNPVALDLGDSSSGILIRQGFLEGSNVNLMNEMMEMMTVQRSAEASRTAMNQQIGTLEKLFEIVRS